jgi:hypothetical protein
VQQPLSFSLRLSWPPRFDAYFPLPPLSAKSSPDVLTPFEQDALTVT